MVADANLFRSIDQFKSIPGLKPGIWKTTFVGEDKDILHWQFHWVAPGPLDLDNLPTEETCPQPRLETGDWEHIDNFSVDSGKLSVFDKDMLTEFIAHTGDERMVIDVCQDPFSERIGYQGVLPGGFFSAYLLRRRRAHLTMSCSFCT